MLSVIYKPCMLSDVMLNVVMLNVAAPCQVESLRADLKRLLGFNVRFETFIKVD